MENEKTVYQGQIIRVTEEKIGSIVWERVYLPSGVHVFPIDAQGKILLIKEVRAHEKPNTRWKLVTGLLESGGDLFDNVNREMQEEIGFKADWIDPFFELKTSGTVNNHQWFVLAGGLTPSRLPNPDGDVILEVRPFTLDEIIEGLNDGSIPWGVSSIGIFKLKRYCEEHPDKKLLS